MLGLVGVPSPGERIASTPTSSPAHAPAVLIAMALASKPKLLIADEPTTALDVTIQAQILDLIRELQQKSGMAVVLITHDLGIVASLCQRLMVMYGGLILEPAPSRTSSTARCTPTRGRCFGRYPPSTAGRTSASSPSTPGAVPHRPAAGLPFAPRCPLRERECEAGSGLHRIRQGPARALPVAARERRHELAPDRDRPEKYFTIRAQWAARGCSRP
jgi:ABC-type dipeptide/oligopeptide/nickel transport system ATPase component